MSVLDYQIVDQKEAEKFYNIITNGLNEYASQFEISSPEYLHIFCTYNGRLVGAIVAKVVASRMNIKWLWVDKEMRNKKIGRNLMTQVEKLAHEHCCDRIFVDTMSYQAPGFYTKMEYQEVARIPDFYPSHDRVFYQKDLA